MCVLRNYTFERIHNERLFPPTKVFECVFLIVADEIPVAQRIVMRVATGGR